MSSIWFSYVWSIDMIGEEGTKWQNRPHPMEAYKVET